MKRIYILILFSSIVKSACAVFVATLFSTDPCKPQVNTNLIPGTIGSYSITASISDIPNHPGTNYQWNCRVDSKGAGKTKYDCAPSTTILINYMPSLSYKTILLCGVRPYVFIYSISLNPVSQCDYTSHNVVINIKTVYLPIGLMHPETIFRFDYGDNSPSDLNSQHIYIRTVAITNHQLFQNLQKSKL